MVKITDVDITDDSGLNKIASKYGVTAKKEKTRGSGGWPTYSFEAKDKKTLIKFMDKIGYDKDYADDFMEYKEMENKFLETAAYWTTSIFESCNVKESDEDEEDIKEKKKSSNKKMKTEEDEEDHEEDEEEDEEDEELLVKKENDGTDIKEKKKMKKESFKTFLKIK
jgi:hypothetical protein